MVEVVITEPSPPPVPHVDGQTRSAEKRGIDNITRREWKCARCSYPNEATEKCGQCKWAKGAEFPPRQVIDNITRRERKSHGMATNTPWTCLDCYRVNPPMSKRCACCGEEARFSFMPDHVREVFGKLPKRMAPSGDSL